MSNADQLLDGFGLWSSFDPCRHREMAEGVPAEILDLGLFQ